MASVAVGFGREVPNWDALAPYWEHFEDGGLNQRTLAAVSTALRPPLLFVGGGRGSLTAVLVERFGSAAVLSVDRSLAMCRRARRDHGLACLAADVARLPLPDASFATVLCATGVLEYIGQHGLAGALGEMGRVCGPGGQVLVCAACSDGDVFWAVDQHRFVEAWYAGRINEVSESARAFGAVASALGSREAARELLLQSWPRVGRAITATELTVAAALVGLEVTASRINDDGIGLWRLVPAEA